MTSQSTSASFMFAQARSSVGEKSRKVKENGARIEAVSAKRKTPGLGGGGPDPGLRGTDRGKQGRQQPFGARNCSTAGLVIQVPQKHGDSKRQLHAEHDQRISKRHPLFAPQRHVARGLLPVGGRDAFGLPVVAD